MRVGKKMKTVTSKNYITQYVIYTYGLFTLLLLTLGGIATVLLNGTPLVMQWLMAITAWTPTYVLLLMFKKLYPNSTVKAFYKEAFGAKINFRLLAVTTAIQIFVFTTGVTMVSIKEGVAIRSLIDFSYPTILTTLFFVLIQGPMGEESGWRGYLLPAMEKKIGIVKASLAVSVIWSFWHAPIWFLGSGYSGTVLAKYIVAFVISITSLGVMISICYHHCKNLFVPIWIHFLFNFFATSFKGSMPEFVVWYAVFYSVTAIGFLLWHKQYDANIKKRDCTVQRLAVSRR